MRAIWPYRVRVSTNRTRESARNLAAVEYIRELKTNKKPRMTEAKLAEATGINEHTVKRLLLNKSDMTLDQFVSLVEALGGDPVKAVSVALSKVRGK